MWRQADETGFSPYPGNINILVFNIPEMSMCLAKTGGIVPEFVNPKWAVLFYTLLYPYSGMA